MRTLLYILTLLFISLLAPPANAQLEYQGINVMDIETPERQWQELEPGLYGKKTPSAYFDLVMYSNNEQPAFNFVAEDATGMIFSRVERELDSRFGEPDFKDDYIPEAAVGDPDYLALLVKQKKAEIVRSWYLDDLEVNFYWIEDLFFVSFKHK